MKKYYIVYPRNFANEFTLFFVNVGDKDDTELLNELLERNTNDPNYDCHRITRKEAERKASQDRKRGVYYGCSAFDENVIHITEVEV